MKPLVHDELNGWRGHLMSSSQSMSQLRWHVACVPQRPHLQTRVFVLIKHLSRFLLLC